MNRTVGWISLMVGIATGLVMGLWSFDGPFAVPAWLGGYADTPRRLARLGHIAFIGLGILNLLLAQELPQSALGTTGRRVAARAMNTGNILVAPHVVRSGRVAAGQVRHGVPGDVRVRRVCLAAWGARGTRGRVSSVENSPNTPLTTNLSGRVRGVFHR